MFAICFLYSFMCIINCFHLIVNILYITSLEVWCRVSFLKWELQFSKFLKNTICIGLCKLKCTENVSSLFPPSIFSLSLSPIQNLKEDLKNVLNHTSFRNYAPFSLQVPSILSILLVWSGGSNAFHPHIS